MAFCVIPLRLIPCKLTFGVSCLNKLSSLNDHTLERLSVVCFASLSFKSTLGLVLFTTVFADDFFLLSLLVKTKTSSLDEAHMRLDA